MKYASINTKTEPNLSIFGGMECATLNQRHVQAGECESENFLENITENIEQLLTH